MNLVDAIRRAVLDGQYIATEHAEERLEERGIPLWQLEVGLSVGIVTDVRPLDEPNPSIVVSQELADGTKVNVVWSYSISADEARLVTAHFFD